VRAAGAVTGAPDPWDTRHALRRPTTTPAAAPGAAADAAPRPPGDPGRTLARARPDDAGTLPHLALAGDTYTVLLTGADTAGRFALIDAYGPPGGGPPPHRHDFEETFSLLGGEVAFTVRGETVVARAGETVDVAGGPRAAAAVCGDAPAPDVRRRDAPPRPRRRRAPLRSAPGGVPPNEALHPAVYNGRRTSAPLRVDS
jgi:quercetin dioxygenase-like cupin family protein